MNHISILFSVRRSHRSWKAGYGSLMKKAYDSCSRGCQPLANTVSSPSTIAQLASRKPSEMLWALLSSRSMVKTVSALGRKMTQPLRPNEKSRSIAVDSAVTARHKTTRRSGLTADLIFDRLDVPPEKWRGIICPPGGVCQRRSSRGVKKRGHSQPRVAPYAVNRNSARFRLSSFAVAVWDLDALVMEGTPVRSRFLFAG